MLLDHHAEDVSQFWTIEFWEQNWGGRSHPMSLAFRPMAKYGASKLKSYNKNSTTLDSQMKHPVFIMGMVNPSSPICKALDQCFGYSSFRVWGSVILVPNFIIEKTLKIIENPSNEFMFWRVFLPKKSSRFGTSQMFPWALPRPSRHRWGQLPNRICRRNLHLLGGNWGSLRRTVLKFHIPREPTSCGDVI